MPYRAILIAALALCLQACATSSPPQRAASISPVLLMPCYSPQIGTIQTWGDVARGLVNTLDAFADCQSRHRALAEAVSTER